MAKAFVASLVSWVALLIVVGVGASCHGHQSAEEAAFQRELPDATPFQFGALTEKQRIHSKLFDYYPVLRQGQGTISDMAAKQAKRKIMSTTVLPGLGPLLQPETSEKFFEAWNKCFNPLPSLCIPKCGIRSESNLKIRSRDKLASSVSCSRLP